MKFWSRSRARKIVFQLLARYFRIAKVPPSFASVAANSSNTIVVTQGDSIVLAAMLESFAKRTGLLQSLHCARLPPDFSFDEGVLYWLSLDEADLLQRLVRAHPTLQFSTLNIFRARGPVRNQPRYRMSQVKQLGLVIGCRFLTIFFGTIVRFSNGQEHLGRNLSRYLRMDFYRNLKLTRGVPFQSMELQAQSALSGPEFERELKIVAQRQGTTLRNARMRARMAFFKMAANPRVWAFMFVGPFCNFLVKKLFNEVTIRGLDNLIPAIKEHTVVLIPMHRSHFDYILLGLTLFNARINTPIVAAGINLSFWPFGSIIRSLGGYFVKRNARNDRIHMLLLKRYVTYLVKRGYLQEFFIEGGRSRSGRMAQPKVGLLSTMVTAYLKGIRKDILFVPTSIIYENVVEGEVFGEENTGRSKAKETLSSLFRARDFFRKKYGEVIIRFGDAIPLSRIASQLNSGNEDGRAITTALATTLSHAIRDQSDISLNSLAYTALLSSGTYGLARDQFVRRIQALVELATISADCHGNAAAFTNSLSLFVQGKHSILDDLERGGACKIALSLDKDVFHVPGQKRFTADFYRNASIHHFLIPALLALFELQHGHCAINDLKSWHEILAYDYQLPAFERFQAITDATVLEMETQGMLVKSAGLYHFKDRSDEYFIPQILLPVAECLLWVLENLECYFDPRLEGPISVSYVEFLARLQNSFRTAIYSGRMTRTEAASQVNLLGALDCLRQRQVISYDESSKADKRIVILRRDSESRHLLFKACLSIRTHIHQ